MKSWLCGFLSSCMCHLKNPKVWRRALIVAIPKPKKQVEDPKNYRRSPCFAPPTRSSRGSYTLVLSRLLTHFSLWSRLVSDGGASTVDQTVLLTQNIEDSFEATKKAGAVLVDLTAAYDTVWHRELTCKLLRLLPDKHMVRTIMELVQNRIFTLTSGDGKQSRLRRLRNGLPQGSATHTICLPLLLRSMHMLMT